MIELYYETEWYHPPPELKPALKNQAQRYPARGCNVRRLDHFNGLAADIKACREFFETYLGLRLTEQIVLDNGSEAGMWLTATNKTYDLAYTRDATGTKGRFHHITYALNSREDVLRAADVFLENGVFIETGPHKHAIQQTFFLYVYEPGGNRVEVACPGARLILAPDWKPIRWSEAERKKGQAWGLQTIKSFHTHGTPPVQGVAGIVIAVMDEEVLQADRALVAALASGDKAAAARLLNADFNWIDAEGRIVTAAQRLPPAPLGDEVGLTPSLRIYGDVACVTVDRDRLFVLRLWVKRDSGWRLLVLHEVSQAVPPVPLGPGRKDWDNPCRTLPYEPRNADERDCLASWQRLETAVMQHEPEVWAAHVADEFTVVGAARRHGKADRKAVIEGQRRSNANSAPAPLTWAELIDFPDVIIMRCEHQPFHGKAARVSRVFVKRDGQWLMAVSYQTTRQDVAVENDLEFRR